MICNMYVTLFMPMVPIWGFGSEFLWVVLSECYCIFSLCRGTWRCEHTLLCVEIVKSHL